MSGQPSLDQVGFDQLLAQVRYLRAEVAKIETVLAERPRPSSVVADDGITAVAEIAGKSRLELRRDCALAGSNSDGRILEIGPAHNAIFPKREGFNTAVLDYLDRDGLVDKYKEFAHYDPNDIEDVDYVMPPGAAMSEVIEEKFDIVLASHVLEHTTTLIGFLKECSALLKPDGYLALVVPDHRYCFDRFRERSGLARIIDTEANPPSVHTMGTLIEERINVTKHRGTTSWAPRHRGDYELVFTRDQALGRGRLAGRGYIDAHNWVFTPNYLRLVLQDLYELGFIDLRETYFHDTVRNEFFVNLSKTGVGTGLPREALLTIADTERRVLDEPTWVTPGEVQGS